MLTKKPKTFKECYRLDETSLNLQKWSESLYNRGDLFFKIHLIIGIVVFIILAISAGQFQYDSLNLILFAVGVGSFVLCLLIGLIIRAIMRTLSILVSAKAHVVHNTRVAANIMLFEAGKNYEDLENEENAELEADDVVDESEETSEELEEFMHEISKLDTRELALVWKEYKDLYDSEEIDAIEQELKRRTDWP